MVELFEEDGVRGAKRSMPGKFASSTFTIAVWIAGWTWNICPTILVYHAQSYSVSAAACTPMKPPPLRMNCSIAACCVASSTSPVVLAKTTAR